MKEIYGFALMKLPLALFAAGAIACGTEDNGAAPDAGTADSGRPPAEGCAAPSGAGSTHQGELTASETWAASGNPHIVTGDINVHAGTLTIEPCAIVRIQEGFSIILDGATETATLYVHGEAILNDDGTTTVRPVTFMPDAANTFWGSLIARSTGAIDLEQVELRGGGAHATASGVGGTLVAAGAGALELTRNVRTVAVLIEGSEGLGVNLQGGAAFTADSRDLTIRGSGQNPSITNVVTDYPLFVVPPALHTIPSGTYTGNAIDAVRVFNAGNITTDEGFNNVGIPYHLAGVFSMSPLETAADGGLITLTIEAGVTIEMEADQSFNLGTSNGALAENIWPVQVIAVGNAAEPIVFTSASATPAAGDWGAIEWQGGPATGNALDYVRIELAGGDSGTAAFGCGPVDNDAALIFTNWRPEEDFIDNLTISDSAAGGIVSGWSTDEDGPDFKEGNTFTNIASSCDVSRWTNISLPVCPGGDNIPDCL